MAKNTRILTDIAFKKLSNASITNPGSSEFQEPIGTNVQLGLGTILGETPPTTPPTTLFETSSGAIVQYVEFDLVAIAEGNYDASTYSGDSSNYDDIDGNPGIEDHAFAVALSGSYQTDGADNPKSGTGLFTNGTYLSGSNGALQLVPPSYGVAYQAVVVDEGGNDLNIAVDSQDFYIDYYAGVVFRQDGSSSPYPTKLKAYLYIGDYADVTIRSGSFSGSFEGDGSNLDLSGNSTIPGAYGDSDVTDHLNSLAVVSGSASDVRTFLNVADGATNYGDTNVKTKLNTENVISSSAQVSIAASQVTEISNLTAGEGAQLENINSVTISNTQWGYLGSQDQAVATTNSPTFNNLTLSGDLTVQGTTTTVDSTTVNISSSIIRVNYGGAVAEGGMEVTDATGGNTVTGSLLWDGNNDYWKGGPKGSEVKLLRETGDGILSGSAQIATDISGAFTAASASFSTRVTANDAKVSYTDAAVTGVINTAGVISGSAQIATEISGAFTAASASFSTRVTLNDAKVGYTDGAVTSVINTAGVLSGSEQIATEISGAFTAASASFSTRVTLNDAKVGYTDGAVTTVINTAGVLSGSEQIATEISGAFTAASASFSTRVTTNDAKVSYTDAAVTSVINTAGVISGSAQIATEISGAFTAASGGFSTRVTANESSISTLQGNEVHTAAAISGAIDAATGSLFSGAPTDDQIAIFTDHNTIEGSSNLTFNGTLLTAATASITQNLTVGGDLTVQGTTTTVNSTEVEIGDNIIILNSANAAADAGIYVIDQDSSDTGSLLYDYNANYWIAGTKGSEKRLVTFNTANPTNDSFIHLNSSDEIVAIASSSDVGAFLQKTATGFEVSATIDGGTY